METDGLTHMDQPLKKISAENMPVRVQVDMDGKSALTRVDKVTIGPRASLLEVQLVTGRTHQIRAHCLEYGYPLVGDRKYGDRARDIALHGGLPPLGLHAHSVRFQSIEGLDIAVMAPMDIELESLIEQGLSAKRANSD